MACSWRCTQCHRSLVQCRFNFRISKFKPFNSIPIPSRFPCFIHALSLGPSAAFVTSRGTEIFEIGADEVPSAVACSKYVKGTVVKAKTRKNGNHWTTLTLVFNYNHWTFFFNYGKNYRGGLGGWVGPIICRKLRCCMVVSNILFAASLLATKLSF